MSDKTGMKRTAPEPQRTNTFETNAFEKVPVRRPHKVTFRSGLSQGIAVNAIEVCQSVQNLDNEVTLIASKPTLVRIYLDSSSVIDPVKLRGELVWRTAKNGPASFLAATNEVRLDPDEILPIEEQRGNLRYSMNFRLPEAAVRSGTLYVQLNRLTQTGGGDQPFSDNTKVQVSFVAAPPIRVRCIGLRYKDSSGNTFTPDAVHFAYFRSYLKRAYPVADVEWSQIVVDADFAPPLSGAAILANAQLAALRNTEINSGTDTRTHYYGLVDDGNGQHFMRGRASGIPASAMPDTVASGPCGIPNGFSGDNDLSYADWYGAHELGHTFGRFHPGFPPGSQDASDAGFPYTNGQISNNDRAFFGYDMGDSALGLEMKVLDGITHHDMMTYADRQWVSAHTFEAIRLRLLAEDEEFAPQVG